MLQCLYDQDPVLISTPSARPGSPTTEDDSIVVQLIVGLSEDVEDSIVPVAASALVGATRLWVSEGNLTVNPNVAKVRSHLH